MWNDGNRIIWYHFVKIVNDDMKNELKLLPKLTLEHVHLTPYSKMRVRLAAQVLSQSVSKVLKQYYPAGTKGTSDLCQFINHFFDCLNVRNELECVKDRNEFIGPYRDVNDPRFDWMKNDLLGFLKSWKTSTENREGDFTQSLRNKMFLSHQTYKGIMISVNSAIEATRFLLNAGMPYVLTERFNQDSLEEYFGRQRSLGRRNDNPTVQQFGYQANTIRMQRSVVRATGNTSGRWGKKSQKSWSVVDDEPLPKRVPGKGLY